MLDFYSIHKKQVEAVTNFGDPPEHLVGKGIITSAYDKEFVSSWVMLNELTRLDVQLPVQVFYREGELTENQIELLQSINDRIEVCLLHDDVKSFAIKPLAIYRSKFEEVLWIDSDNTPIRDPSFLFYDEEYVSKGSLFWRDVGVDKWKWQHWVPEGDVWKVFNVPYNDAEDFDTGQFLINKRKCWKQLGLTIHFNINNHLYWNYTNGDANTFRFAWQNLYFKEKNIMRQKNCLADPEVVPYGFMPYGPFHMGKPNPWAKWGGGSVMVQRDRDGKPLFNHRTIYKFKLEGNVNNTDIINEKIYHEHIVKLRLLI